VFSFVRWLPLSLVVMVGVGMGFMLIANTTNALVQTLLEDRLRGRVMGVYTLVFFGAMPIGSLLAGTLAARIGEPLTIIFSAVTLLTFSVLMIWRWPAIRALE
jgi:MFS family permease